MPFFDTLCTETLDATLPPAYTAIEKGIVTRGNKVVDVAERRGSEKDEIRARLRRVEGQIRGIQRMVEEDRDCEAVVTQLTAARAALDRASLLILSRHLERCLTDSSADANQAQLNRILEFFLKFSVPAPETKTSQE